MKPRCLGVSRIVASAGYLTVALWGLPAGATVYHISQASGADGNDGTQAHPWLTISACAKAAQAGDVCRVHAGRYRETVSPVNSGTPGQPIRFEVADGECATVLGTEPLTASFAPDQGNVWAAAVADSIEQLFSNGTMVWEGQWPNRTPGVLFDAPKGIAGPGTGVQTVNGVSVTTLVDPNIPAVDWTGALVYMIPGQRWQSDSRPVLAFDATTHTITLDTTLQWAAMAIPPVQSNQYYLYGSKLTLDTQDEWVWLAGNLYYYSTDDPATHNLEYKKRYYAFDVQQSYIEIVGLHAFASAVRLIGNHNTVDSLSIEYSSHLRSFNAYATQGAVNQIVGDDNTWKNSIIEKSGSAGLIVAGNRNLIENNVVNDVAYQATNNAGLDMDDWTVTYQGNQFIYNTVARSGRAGIFQLGSQNGRVLYNKVSDWALLTNDTGGIYAWGTDVAGTDIAYNDVGGCEAFWCTGVYLDANTPHFVVHHNYVHDLTFFGMSIKQENRYFNNTFEGVGTPFSVDTSTPTGSSAAQNLAKVENNLTDGTLLVLLGILPTIVTDWGSFEAEVRPTPEWQHFNIAFSSLYQPGWFRQAPLDLTSISSVSFTPSTNGDFEFDIDNIRFEGANPLLLDDFEAGGANGLGGQPLAGGSANSGGAGTSVTMTFAAGGPSSSSTKYASVSGTIVLGNNSYGSMNESIPNKDVSQYTGISFDMRGQMRGFNVLTMGNGGLVQDHNGNCPITGTDVPACAVDQGAVIAGITDGFQGAAPDIGAFESGVLPFVAGAQRAAEPSQCGKIADITSSVPRQPPNPWSPLLEPDAGTGDAGPSTPDAGLLTPDSGTGISTAGGGGCGCRTIGTTSKSSAWVTLLALAGILRVRQSRPKRRN